ncbi:MAG: S9 family peptidase, partial [Candidatus Eremiobacteraeota bacterium]|nr:S9 family peptidase [Candidatus Eremiobacteraeota bacterium]
VLNDVTWSPDGKTLAALATAHAHKEIGATQAGAALTGDLAATLVADVQRIAVVGRGGALRYASPANLFVYEYDWMPNSLGFVGTGAHGNGDNEWWVARLYAFDAATASAREIARPPFQLNAPRVSPDGTRVAFIGGLMSDFGAVGGDVYTVPLAGGTPTDLTPSAPYTVTSLQWMRDGALSYTGLHGSDEVVGMIGSGFEPPPPPPMSGVGRITTQVHELWSAPLGIMANERARVAFARDGVTSVVVRQDFDHAQEIAVGPVGHWTPLTHENAALAPYATARSVTWTNDGFTVQGWLLAPRGADATKKHPMIVIVHGGPSAAVTPGFAARGAARELLDHGYFVFEPNPRGSYGQGEAFTAANVKDFGGGDFRDILAGVDAVEKVAPVDDARLGIFGHSYGGYMSMWAVTQTHRFKAAVAGAGLANWLSYYGENGIDEWMIPFFGASVYDDPAVYAKSAPITFVKNAHTPTFMYVGERDVECPAPQSQEFWHALQTLGVPTSLVIYAGEGHGIRDPKNVRDIARRTLAWFDKYLR